VGEFLARDDVVVVVGGGRIELGRFFDPDDLRLADLDPAERGIAISSPPRNRRFFLSRVLFLRLGLGGFYDCGNRDRLAPRSHLRES